MRFVLLDRILSLDPPTGATGTKCVSLTDDVFADHFPGLSVYPGTLVVEALAQLGGVLIEETLRIAGRGDLFAVLMMIERAKIRTPVRPGDRLDLEVTGLRINDLGGRVRGVVRVEGARVAEAESLAFAVAALENERLAAHRRALLETWRARPTETS